MDTEESAGTGDIAPAFTPVAEVVVTYEELRAVALEFRQARAKFEASKRPLTILPDWAPRRFWSAAELSKTKVVSGEALGTLIEELSIAREAWGKLRAAAKHDLVAAVEKTYSADEGEGVRKTVPNFWGRIDESYLLIDGDVQPLALLSSLSLYSFDLHHCLIDGDLKLDALEIESLFRLDSVQAVLSPASSSNVKQLHDWLFASGRVRSANPDPEMLRLGAVFLVGARVGALRINEFTAYAIVADRCDIGLWTELSGVKLREFSLDGSLFHNSWTASDRVTLGRMTAEGAIFEGPVDCSHAKLASLAASRAQFKQGAYFRSTTFESAPVFHDTTFSSDTDFFGALFPRGDPADRDATFAARGAYRALRIAMNKAKAHDEELYFFRLEQRTTRQLRRFWEAPVWTALSYAYDWISNYGTAPGRALAALLIWNTVFAVYFSVLLAVGPRVWATGVPLGFGYVLGVPTGTIVVSTAQQVFTGLEGLGLAVQNATNPLALITYSPAVRVHNGSVFALSLVQSVGSLGIVALFFLAVRNRFQRSGGG